MGVNDNLLGVSSTNMNDRTLDIYGALGGGAKAGQQAMDIANQLYPEVEEADPWEAAFRFFAEMGKAASVPGSTALGAAVSSMAVPLDYLTAKKDEKTKTDRARTKTALSLGSSLNDDAGTVYKVQSSKILDGNVTITVFSDGRREVTGPDGNLVTGETARRVITEAENRGTELQGDRAGNRRAATVAVNTSLTAFDQVAKSRSKIANLTEARRLVAEEGANTGYLADNFPSWKASSVALDTVKNELGLDVVGSVTFGALSQGELNLALSTALPTALSEDALVDWIDRKIIAQEKLQDYLYGQAVYLSDGNKTIGDWLRSQKADQEESERIEAKRRQSENNFNFSVMLIQELRDIDTDSLTDSEFDAWDKRMTELGY